MQLVLAFYLFIIYFGRDNFLFFFFLAVVVNVEFSTVGFGSSKRVILYPYKKKSGSSIPLQVYSLARGIFYLDLSTNAWQREVVGHVLTGRPPND